MKKHLKTGKKVLSVFMAALMVMTAWVFFAPEKAEAATAGQYYYRVTFQVTNTMDNVQMLSTLYGRKNNGTGDEVAIASKNYTSDKDFSGTMLFMEGWTDNGVFPTRFHIGDNNGAKYYMDRDREGYWHVYVGPNNSNLTEVYLNAVKHSSEAENMSVGSGQGAKWYWQVRNNWFTGKVNRFNIDYNVAGSYYPYINSLTEISGVSNITMPKTGAGNKTEQYTATASDQYGKTWYADPTFYIRANEPTDYNSAKTAESLTGLSISGGKLTVTPSAQIDGEEINRTVWISCVAGTDKWAKKKVTLTDPIYKITFVQDGVTGTLKEENCHYGSMPTAPGHYTIPKYTDKTHFVFDGWEPEVKKATVDQTYKVKFKEIPHNWTEVSRKAPTCRTTGELAEKCEDCGATRNTTLQTVDHDFSVFVRTVAPTCEDKGYNVYKCSYGCGNEEKRDFVDANGHKWELTNTVGAGCETDGTEYYKCSVCGKTKQEKLEKLGHNYVEIVSKEPTCETEGWAQYKCSRCGAYDSTRGGSTGTSVDALGHDWDEWFTDVAAKCEEPGVSKRICKRDPSHEETKEIPKLNHDYDETVTRTKEPTCTMDGYTYHPCKHSGCTSVEIIETIPKRGHDEENGEWKITSPAKCETDGVREYFCGRCGESIKSETIQKIGHKFTTYTKSKDATCLENAKETAVCDNGCGKSDVRDIKDTALGHEFLDENYKYDNNAKCEQNGTETAKCTRCYATKTREKPGTALEHEFKKYEVTKPATCLEDAEETAKCNNNCGKTNTRTVANSRLGHTCENFTHNTGTETCCELGTKTGTCTRCKTEYTVAEDRPEYYAAHTYATDSDGNIVYTFIDGSANCEHDGLEEAYCINAGIYADGKNWDCKNSSTRNGRIERTAEDTKLPHNFEGSKYVSNNDGTCQRDGTMTALCNMCHKAKHTVTEPNSKKDHYVANWISDGNATCTMDGTKHGYCAYGCGTKFENEPDEGSALGHWFRDYKVTAEATCTTDRVRTATCEREGCTATESVTDIGSALGHKWSDWEFVDGEEADCTTGGTMTRHCERGCLDKDGNPLSETKTVEATAHTWTWVIINETGADGEELPADCTRGYKKHQICSVCGIEKEGSVVEVAGGAHHFVLDEKTLKDATCTEDGYRRIICDVCGYVESEATVPATGHVNTYLDEDTVVAATCKDKGYSGDYKCTLCKTITEYGHETPVTSEHVFDTYLPLEEATCTKNATEKAICSVCGEAENTREVPASALGHSFTEFVVDENTATCTSDGTKTAHCDREGCTATKTMRDVGSALGHNWGDWVTVEEPTCTKTGKAERKCEREGCNLKVEKQLRQLSHTPSDWIIDEEATCTSEGKRHKECTGGCGYIFEEEVIPTLEHDFVIEIHGVTCIDDGYSTYTCSVCGAKKQGGVVKALGHDWSGEWVVTKEPTCTKKGTETLTCTRCDKTQTRKIEALGHHEVIDPAVPATCTEPGLSEGSHCDRCGKVLKEQETVIKPHRDADEDGKCDECGKDIEHSTDLNCNCICHKQFWLMKLLYKVLRTFWKLFGIGKGCSCGAVHY